MADLAYQREIAFLKRKAPTLKVEWQEKPMMEQIISPGLPLSDVEPIYQKLKELFKIKKTVDPVSLMQLIKLFTPERNPHQSRVIISVPLLLKFFGDEMTDWSGGGGRKLKVDTTPKLTIAGMGRR